MTSAKSSARDKKFQLWGWLLFVLCAIFFAAGSLKNRDWLGLAGSIVFLAACLAFLWPLVIKADRSTESKE